MKQTEAEKLRTWDAWHLVHQPFELKWWADALLTGHCVDDPEFEKHWRPIRDFIQADGVVIDIGCGPRPPFAPCIAIDSLAEQYRRLPEVKSEWWHGVMMLAAEAETNYPNLHGKANTVICWNCLDHTIGWKAILDNMIAYGAPKARFAIATDFWEPFVGHPGYDRKEFEREIDKRFEIIEQREPFDRQLALLMRAK